MTPKPKFSTAQDHQVVSVEEALEQGWARRVGEAENNDRSGKQDADTRI